MWRTTLAFSILAIFTSITSVVANTHYVSNTGSNSPPYTSWETAADSVKSAIEAASSWDTVRVGPGLYIEDSIQLKTGMTLIGAGLDSSTLEISKYDSIFTQFILMADSSRIEGFILKGKSNFGDRAVSFRFGDGGVVSNVRIRDFNEGIFASLIAFKDPSNVVEISSSIVELAATPIDISDGYAVIRNNRIYPPGAGPAIYCLNAAPTIEGNIIGGVPPSLSRAERSQFYGPNEDLAIHQSITVEFCPDFIVRNNLMWGGNTGVYVNNEDSPNLSLPWGVAENNTFFDVAGRALRIRRNNVLVRNNLISEGGRIAPVVQATLDSVRFEYNLIWSYDVPPDWDTNLASENVFAEPMFADTIDFLLQVFSPAIDAGDPSILDADGSRSDIGYTGGPGGFSYTYLDLPPAIPRRFVGTPSAIQIALSWSKNHEADFYRYELYRDTLPILAADSELLLVSLSSDTVFVDSMIFPKARYHYRLRAVDAQANASDLTDELQFVAAGVDGDDPLLPGTFILHPNYPNPFNASTRFGLDVPMAGRVRVAVYDVLGRRVSTLHDGALPPGRHELDWKPENAGSGVYFIVARFDGMTRIGKLLLLK